jgi:phosphate/sulfate permease
VETCLSTRSPALASHVTTCSGTLITYITSLTTVCVGAVGGVGDLSAADSHYKVDNQIILKYDASNQRQSNVYDELNSVNVYCH